MLELERQVRFRSGFYCHIRTYGGYSLALLRNLGQSSAQTALSLAASGDVHGDVTTRRIIATYEARASVANKLITKGKYSKDFSSADNCEVFRIQSDGTNHEAVQNHKVHLNVVSSIAIPHGMMSQSIEVLEEIASHSRQAGEL